MHQRVVDTMPLVYRISLNEGSAIALTVSQGFIGSGMVFRDWRLGFVLLLASGIASAVEPKAERDDSSSLAESIRRGRTLYLSSCSMCHQPNGRGSGTTYPPLFQSDYLRNNPVQGIRAIVAGLSGEISVNGQIYHGQMPAALLPDPAVADVLNFVFRTFDIGAIQMTPEKVAAVRDTTAFPTFAKLSAAAQYRPLPHPPEGFSVSELARLPDFATRMTSDGRGRRLFVLGLHGTVWSVDLGTKKFNPILNTGDWEGLQASEFSTLGVALDSNTNLWLTANQRVEGSPYATNEVSIYRTTRHDAEGNPVGLKRWFKASYPYGVGPYNHGVSDLRFGPDGLLYVSSGSRTDGGEPGNESNLSRMGETTLTASIWRLDPKVEIPQIEVIARGIRNAYSINWDSSGRLFTVSNGPDAHAAEEMDIVTPPKADGLPEHHGFPYQFADAPASTRWYPHTPVAPPGLNFVLPVINEGPDGLIDGQPTSTFTPHSSPAGLVWTPPSWPEAYRNAFLVGRFGNLIVGMHDKDAGFDVLCVHLQQRAQGQWVAQTRTFLNPLGRPIDLHLLNDGRLFVLEYTRPTDFKSQAGWLPGRILEVRPINEPTAQ